VCLLGYIIIIFIHLFFFSFFFHVVMLLLFLSLSIDVRVRNEIANANEIKELTPSEMEDLIHLQGPLTGE
jgi:hypothetical protein